ncbi:MAG: zinc ribbon domain-containing protein [Oscillospiraceae bacterium]|nr:zinc ribbon domain-containing protein [Oscillospiraceae bacterium]MDY3257051.1 zinc ribbon domain-containing protein [Ruminococcus callidus]
MVCGKCGHTLKDDAVFCPHCGSRVGADSVQEKFSGGTNQGYDVPWQRPESQSSKKSNFNDNINDGINRMQESDSFVFRSLGLTLRVLFSKPIRLWGLSLLSIILYAFASALCFGIPILAISAVEVLKVGMCCVYLDAYNKKEVDSKQIFSGFSSFGRFCKISGGMLWKNLWLLLWMLVPIVGPIICFVKAISYSFTPYILLKKPKMSPLDALKYSMKLTDGYKLKIFLTALLVGIILLAVFLVESLVVGLFVKIGVAALIMIFTTVFGLINLVIYILLPLFFGTLSAAMFTEVLRLKKINDIEL